MTRILTEYWFLNFFSLAFVRGAFGLATQETFQSDFGLVDLYSVGLSGVAFVVDLIGIALSGVAFVIVVVVGIVLLCVGKRKRASAAATPNQIETGRLPKQIETRESTPNTTFFANGGIYVFFFADCCYATKLIFRV